MHRLLLMSVVGATVLCTVGAQNDNSTGELALPNPKVFINLFICFYIFHSIYLFFLRQGDLAVYYTSLQSLVFYYSLSNDWLVH